MSGQFTLRGITRCLSVLALTALAAGVSAGSASAATQRIVGSKAESKADIARGPERGTSPGPARATFPRTVKTRVQWKKDIAQLRQPGRGCYRAAYPVLRWHAARCVKAPRIPFRPRPLARSAHHAGPENVGDGTDFSAIGYGLTSQATGTFTDVSPGITEQGLVNNAGSPTANAFSLQINSQFFSGSPACDGSSDPSQCQAWQQFVYTYSDTVTGLIFMQYWLLNYDATCPSGWYTSGNDCWTNSNANIVDTVKASDLANIALSGSAASGGNDSVSLAFGAGQATSVTNSDSVLDLASFWTVTEWGVYGDGNASEADFGPGTTLEAQTALTTAGTGAPYCLDEGFTGETNNLSRTSTPALGDESSPTMAFAQTNGPTGTANCASAAGNPALIGVLNGGTAYVKEGGLSAPWVAEASGISEMAVATDPRNGPLIGVLTTDGTVWVKEGGLSAPWVQEATGISQLAVATDPVNGPLIGVLSTGGIADVKEGSLSAPWVFEDSGVSQIALASDDANGPLIGVLTGGTALVKEGSLYASWTNELTDVSQLALASDAGNGPLIGVLTSDGNAYVKEGGLSATWTYEYDGVAQLAVASDASNGPLIGVVTTGGTALAKEGGLSATWTDETDGWLALASEPVYGPLISVLVPGGEAFTKQGGLSATWIAEAPGVSQVVSAG
jgi:hypothetical protein